MRTIPDLIADVARRHGRRPALGIRRGLRTELWSYQDVEHGMLAAAERLRSRGVEPGDRVLVLAPNSPELVLSMLGIWAAGAVLVPIDLRTPADVMARIVEQTTPKLLISELPGTLPDLPTVRPSELSAPLTAQPPPPHEPLTPRPPLPAAGAGETGSPLPRTGRGAGGEGRLPPLRADVGIPRSGGCRRSRYSRRAAAPPFVDEGGRGGEVGLAEVVFTSGTTGAPKGVMLTHANILANAASAQQALPIEVGERLLSLLPLSHMMEQTAGLIAALAAGATIFYATSRRSSAILAGFQRHRIGLLICVPEVLSLLMAGIEREVDRSGQRRVWDALHTAAARLPIAARPALFRAVHRRLGGHFRMALCGGAPLGEDLQAAWERLGVRVIQGYGATECAPIIASNRYDRRVPGSVGWPLPDVEVRLAQDGEVLVRGPNVTPGYWHDPAATAASFEGDWYRTGDLGEFVGDSPTPWSPPTYHGAAARRESRLPRDPALRASPWHRLRRLSTALRWRGEQAHRFPLSIAMGRGVGGGAFPLRLRGRKKEMIVLSDGRNVFPDDVEPILRADTAVKECAVVGRPRGSGVEVHAVVIPADTSNPQASAEAAVRRANGKLGPHQQIGGWSVWNGADFPRTPSLKIKRAEVLAALAEQRAPTQATPAAIAGNTLQERVTVLLARATGRPADRIRPESDLHLDLGLDSLGRVELAVLLEEELGQSPSDEQVAELRTVADLLGALEQPASIPPPTPLPRWPRSWPVQVLRAVLQDAVLFPALRLLGRPLVIEEQEQLARLRGPALLIANHASHLDSVTVLAALPPARRRRAVVAAAADYFFADRRRALVASAALGAFPFHRTGPVAASLAHCGDLADAGHSLLVFPEGTRSTSGRIAPFKPGIGLLARELGLPVVPVYLDGLFEILPKGRTVPRPGRVGVVVGTPLRVDPSLTNAEAAARLEAALRALAPPGR
jgi:acyl carrier protein